MIRKRSWVMAAFAVTALSVGLSPVEAAETISGSVHAAAGGAPLAGIDLDVLDTAKKGASIALKGDTTGADGSYTVTLPHPGSYLVRADPKASQPYASQYYNGAFLKSAAQAVNVGSGAAATNINFSLPGGTTISGTVTTKGTPLADIDIDIFASNHEFLGTYPAKTTANGTYTVGALPAGTYFLRADPKGTQPYVGSFYGGSQRVIGAKPIVLGSTPVAGIDISLEPRDPKAANSRKEK